MSLNLSPAGGSCSAARQRDSAESAFAGWQFHGLIARANLGSRAAPVKALLHALAYHADPEGKAFPGLNRLKGEAGLGNDALIAAIKRAETLGVLTVMRAKKGIRAAGGRASVNRYQLNRRALEALANRQVNSPDSGEIATITPESGEMNESQHSGSRPRKSPAPPASTLRNPVRNQQQEPVSMNQDNSSASTSGLVVDQRPTQVLPTIRSVLHGAGLRSPGLDTLTRACKETKLTSEQVAKLAAEAKAACPSAHNIGGFIHSYIAGQIGHQTRAARLAELDPETRKALSELERTKSEVLRARSNSPTAILASLIAPDNFERRSVASSRCNWTGRSMPCDARFYWQDWQMVCKLTP